MPLIQRLKLHDGQKAIINSRARYRVASCGRRFGKTMLAGYWLALRDAGSAVGGKRCAWFAPNYKLLMDAWGDIERSVRPIARRVNKTEQRIELTTGGVIDFWTLEDKDAGRGRRYHRLVIDEAAHARYLKEAWERAISPTLTDFRGSAWFVSTPNGLNYFHDLYQRGLGGDPDWQSFHLPSSANPFLPPDEIAQKRLELPGLVFSQEYLAEFVTFGAGLVKPEHIQEAPCPASLPVVLGVDLAISEKEGADWTAIAAMSRDPATGIIYLRGIERHRAGFNEVLNRIKAAAAYWKPAAIAIEQVQYQAAVVQELLRTTSLPVRGVRPDRDKVTRFAPLLTRYEQGLVHHDPSGVPSWFREELLAFPDGQHDDGVDAVSLAYRTLTNTISTASPQRIARPEDKLWL